MKSLLSFLAFFIPCSLAQAQVFQGPLAASMGGTGRAGIDSVEGAFLNPALISLVKNYEFDGYYRDGTLDPNQHRQAWGGGVVDNSSDVIFPAAFNYIRLRDSGVASGPTNGELMHVAVAQTYKDVAVGISGYRLDSRVDSDREYVQWNYTLGTLWRINPDMGVAYVLNNIAKPGSDVPAGLRQDLQQGAGFFASVGGIARVRLDITRNEVNNVDKKMVYMVGCENELSSFGVFRVGYRRDDQLSQDYVTLGLGLQGPRLKLDYAFEKNLKGTDGALHSVDIRLPF
jgi:hypothetical protein